MSITKIIARKIVLPISLALKLDKFILKRAVRSCCIVNFHGVRKLNSGIFNNRHIPVNEFEKIIKYLKRHYDIVPLSEIFTIHREKKLLKRKTISLTFDDGYENNFAIALPVLKKYNVPATFYIITKGLIDQNYYVWPDFIDIIKSRHKEDIELNGYIFKYPTFYSNHLKLDILNYLKTCGDKTESIASELSSELNYHSEIIRNSPELIALIRAKDLAIYKNEPLIEYGSHTHSHFNLEHLNNDKCGSELKESKQIIENIVGKEVISLAFPDGSYTNETIEIANRTGYKNLVAVDYKYNETNTLPNLLSRFTISNSTTFESNAIRLAQQFDKYGFN